MSECQHLSATMVDYRGLGTWQYVEIYQCDQCGARAEVDGIETDEFVPWVFTAEESTR